MRGRVRLPGSRTVIAALLCLAGALGLGTVALRTVAIDAYHFWTGVRLARSAGPGLYRPEAATTLVALTPEPRSRVEAIARAYWQRTGAAAARLAPQHPQSPFFWAAMRVVLAGEYEPALRRWQLLAVGGLLAGILLLARAARLPPLAGGALVAFAGIAFVPARDDVGTGNTSSLLLLAAALWVTLAGASRPRLRLAGDALVGLTLAFKPVLALLPVFVLAERWARGERARALARALAFGAGTTTGILLGAAYMGSLRAWPAWLRSIGTTHAGGGNISPLRLLGAFALGPWPTLVAVAAGTLFVAVAARRQVGDAAEGARAALGALRLLALALVLFLLTSPLVWIHYLVLALPAVTTVLAPWSERRSLAAAGIAATLAIGYVPQQLGLLAGYPSAFVAVTGIALLAALVAAEIWGSGRAGDALVAAAADEPYGLRK